MRQALILLPILGNFFVSAQDELFDDCESSVYYGSVDLNDPSQLEKLLFTTHRQVLPYTDNDDDDVWKALIDLDPGNEPGTVRLIYSQRDIPALPHGESDTWNREHIWPKSRGVETAGADYTDIHHLRPADWNVNAARSNRYFDNCQGCSGPAHVEAADDTAKDSDSFLPPENVRGEIARALFYMAIRYSDSNNGFDDLILTDCPPGSDEDDGSTYMAYKSVLLQWHDDFPVTAREEVRNERACSRWQGNRNPFVDHPDLAQVHFGLSKQPPYTCDGPISNPVPTSPPAASPPTESATKFGPGSVMVVAMESDDPDLFALVALDDIPAGIDIVVTDNAWTGESFKTNEGSMVLNVENDITRGTLFGYGGNQRFGVDWLDLDSGFSLSASGDTIIGYWQEDGADAFNFLFAFSFDAGDWAASGAQEYGTDESALPTSLVTKDVNLPHSDNYVYVGTTIGSKGALQAALRDRNNWEGSNNKGLFESSSLATQSRFSVTSASEYRANGKQALVSSVVVLCLSLL